MVALVEVAELAHAYGEVPVLQAMTFTLPAGAIGCFLGPSGCGKTTLLRCLAGFEGLLAGEIRFNGRVMSTPRLTVPPESRRVGFVFQDYALFPHLSVEGNVGFGLRRWKKPRLQRRVAEMLKLVGLDRLGRVFPHELSGGQQQRVALARALAPGPDLLLLDEPFSNLDVELRGRLSIEVRDIIKEIGATAILVTHDQYEAFALADRVGVMRGGCLEQWDAPYDLYHRPGTRFVADFVGQGVFLRGILLSDNRVATELGELNASLGGLAPASGEVEVLLRPDDIVHDDASPLRARVASRAFRGAEFLYTLRLPSDTALLSLVPSHHDHAVGEDIGIRVAIDHVIAFAATPAGVGVDGEKSS